MCQNYLEAISNLHYQNIECEHTFSHRKKNLHEIFVHTDD